MKQLAKINDMNAALNEDFLNADRYMLWILIGHALIGIFITSLYYGTFGLGLFIGSAVMLNVFIGYRYLKGTIYFRMIAALAIVIFSALYIQQHLGRIEMHFHVFIGLAILTVYKDILPLLTAAFAVVAHHFLFNYLQFSHYIFFGDPIMIFSYGCGIEYVILHGVMVAAETIVLYFIIRNLRRQFVTMINLQKETSSSNEELITINERLDDMVQQRTAQIVSALDEQKVLTSQLEHAKIEAESANRLKSEFLANMSHEIRTPLNAVIGFSDLLENEVENPKHRGYLEAIKNGGKNLLLLINDILDFSKIEAGHMKLEYHPVSLDVFIRDITSMFTQIANKKGIVLVSEIAKDVPNYVIIDEIHIRQILFNLISNALKFTQNGQVSIKIEQGSIHDSGDITLVCIVKDTGIGIPLKDQAKIFESFIQQEGQDTRQYGGTGLGLAICRKLAHLMGGELSVESIPEKGSTFTLMIDNIEVSQPIFVSEDLLVEENTLFEPATILVVDDIKENRFLMIETLKGYPFTFIEAENGKIAVDEVANGGIDLVLMDIRMPVMNGFEALHAIRNDLNMSDLPLIAVTASVMKHDLHKLEQQFNGVLEKPLNRSILIATLKKHLPFSSVTPAPKISTETIIDDATVEVLGKLFDELLRESQELLQQGDMMAIGSFAVAVIDNGKNYQFAPLIEWGERLRIGAEGFEIDQVETQLRNFATLIEAWRNLWKTK
jgi:signal transduction histidine kinase/CheY-like chemotaxis protein